MASQYALPAAPARSTPPLQQQPAPGPVWQPDQLPPVGQIRTDGASFALYLPLGLRDWAPWRLLGPIGCVGQPVTHAAVHTPEWRVLPTVLEFVTAEPSPTKPAPSAPDPAYADVRVFYASCPQPDDIAAVVTPDGQVWSRSDWHGAGAWMPWDELVSTHGGAVEVPVGALLQHGYKHQHGRTA